VKGGYDIMVAIGLVKDNSAGWLSHLFSSSTNCYTDNKKKHLTSHVIHDGDNLSGANDRPRPVAF